MCNSSSCIFILTQLFGFVKCDNDTKIQLPDEVEIDTLVEFRNVLRNSGIKSNLNDGQSSYEMKMIENNNTVDNESKFSFWSCNHCTYHNSMNLDTCEMCALPHNVCVNQCEYFILHKNQVMHFLLCNIRKRKQGDSLEADNCEQHLRAVVRKLLAQKIVSDKILHAIICFCARFGWVEELRLAVNVPRSSVECCR